MGESILEFEKIEKGFSGVPALRGISFALQTGHILGLAGENGAGKSTAMNILGGVIRADAGAIRYSGRDFRAANPADAIRQGIAFIHQELNLFPNLSIAENFFIAAFPSKRLALIPWINRKEMRCKSQVMLDAVELSLSPDMLVEKLSQGERQLVEIAKALSSNARLIILDEPTTSLTTREAERLFGLMARLKARGISMIYISHNLEDVLRLCDEVLVLRDGAVVASGSREEFTKEKIISCMVGREMDQYYPPRSFMPSAEVILDARGISQPGIVENICFQLRRGEVLGIAGLMGAGRSELARLLFGLEPFTQGELHVEGRPLHKSGPRDCIRRGMAFLTDDRHEEGLLMEASVADNVALAALPSVAQRYTTLLNRDPLREGIMRHVESLRIASFAVEKQKVKSLSGGNQQKVVFAKWLMAKPSVFILDEPTRGIDVGAKHEVYRIINDLAGQGAGVLFISSELEELMGMCDRILVMNAGEITGCLERPDFDRERILGFAFGGAQTS